MMLNRFGEQPVAALQEKDAGLLDSQHKVLGR